MPCCDQSVWGNVPGCEWISGQIKGELGSDKSLKYAASDHWYTKICSLWPLIHLLRNDGRSETHCSGLNYTGPPCSLYSRGPHTGLLHQNMLYCSHINMLYCSHVYIPEYAVLLTHIYSWICYTVLFTYIYTRICCTVHTYIFLNMLYCSHIYIPEYTILYCLHIYTPACCTVHTLHQSMLYCSHITPEYAVLFIHMYTRKCYILLYERILNFHLFI